MKKELEVFMSNITPILKQLMDTMTESLQNRSVTSFPNLADRKNDVRSGAQQRAEIASSGNCFRCGQPGHIAKNFPGTPDHLN